VCLKGKRERKTEIYFNLRQENFTNSFATRSRNSVEMDSEKYFEYLVNKAIRDVQSFKGWDFSFLTSSGRMVESPHKWNYINKLQPYLSGIETLLDIGTGGGEVMARLQPLPELSYAVEDYPPNINVARERLEPLGVKVIAINQDNDLPFGSLPFEDNYFDLVINRHTGCTDAGVYRIFIRMTGQTSLCKLTGAQT
jgi:SAM-dependent methyltransferase